MVSIPGVSWSPSHLLLLRLASKLWVPSCKYNEHTWVRNNNYNTYTNTEFGAVLRIITIIIIILDYHVAAFNVLRFCLMLKWDV